MENNYPKCGIFPLGEKVTPNPKGFAGGDVWTFMFTPLDPQFACPVGNVTYSPGSRNAWHAHPGGQILLVTGGRGWYCEAGKPAQALKAGNYVLVPPGVRHWHGAAKDSFFSHIGIVLNAQEGISEGFEQVSDEEYDRLP